MEAHMIVVREVFVAKPGQASKLAGVFKQTVSLMPGTQSRVLTDAVGEFNTVVFESEFSDMATFEKRMHEYLTRTDLRDVMKGYTDMYITGRREIFRLA
jgi:hypothetical protein